MVKLVGYKKFTSRAGRDCCVASIVRPFSERDKTFGAVGEKAEEIFMPESQVDLLKPSDVGHELILDYDMSDGRAFLYNVTVK